MNKGKQSHNLYKKREKGYQKVYRCIGTNPMHCLSTEFYQLWPSTKNLPSFQAPISEWEELVQNWYQEEINCIRI